MARARTDTFVIGIDSATDALAYATRRIGRDRTPNVALIVGSVEAVARDLAGMADEVRVHFPWGSLLRGVIGEDDEVLDGVAALPRVGGSVTAIVSIVRRDGVALEPIDAARVAARWLSRGLTVDKLRPLTKADVNDAASTWGKKLGAGTVRSGLYLRAVKRTAWRGTSATGLLG